MKEKAAKDFLPQAKNFKAYFRNHHLTSALPIQKKEKGWEIALEPAQIQFLKNRPINDIDLMVSYGFGGKLSYYIEKKLKINP